MKKTHLVSLCLLFVFLFPLFFEEPVSAHGGDPRIEISPERLNPGGVLDIRGVDFEFEEQVDLDLVGQQAEVPFGTVLADVEGIFLLTITLPIDLKEGMYVIRATTDDHLVESAPIIVWSTADLGSGEQGPREEEDGLLAPMPTFAPAVATEMPPAAAPVESTVAKNAFMPLVWIAAGIGILIFLGLVIKRKN